MNNDKFQNKYDEIFQDLKEEKMDWNFEDFLKKADEVSSGGGTIIPIKTKKSSFPKWFWMAASILLFFGLVFILNYNQTHCLNDKAKWVENEIQKQKSDFIKENHDHFSQMAVHQKDSVSSAKRDSVFTDDYSVDEDVLDKILSKKSRIKKKPKIRYASHLEKESIEQRDSTGYKDSYVIVNGKRIDDMEEAINVTKYSFQVVADNFNQALTPKVMDNVED